MRASSLLTSLLLLPATLASASAAAGTAAEDTQTPLVREEKAYRISIWTQPLVPVPNLACYQKLAKIIYKYPSLNTTVNDYDFPDFTIPETPGGSDTPLADNDIVKLGFYSGRIGDEDTWHGIATAAGLFKADMEKTLKLHLDENGKVWHIGFSSVPKKTVETAAGGKKGKKNAATGGAEEKQKERDTLHVELLPVNKGPEPQLNKPVVVSKEGKPEAGEEEQKTFLQKYWWAIGLFLLLQVVMGGGGDK